MLKSIYRKEPILSVVATAGAVNVAIGGLGEHWTLMSVGLSAVGVAIALGVRQRQMRRPVEPVERPPVYVLPPSSSSGLPMLNIAKKSPPRR